MMSEAVLTIQHKGLQTLRYARRPVSENQLDFGHAIRVGDKAIRIYASNLVEIVELEFVRDESIPGNGKSRVAFTEGSTWTTQYPRHLSLEAVKASIDFAFMSAGLNSVFFLTNIVLLPLESQEDLRIASIKAFHALYPGMHPCRTELNRVLKQYADDQFAQNAADPQN